VLRQLRFQQTAGGLRVLWSQIDVAIVGGRVSSIDATVVPVADRAPAGKRRMGFSQDKPKTGNSLVSRRL
jgi:hypothetical protein